MWRHTFLGTLRPESATAASFTLLFGFFSESCLCCMKCSENIMGFLYKLFIIQVQNSDIFSHFAVVILPSTVIQSQRSIVGITSSIMSNKTLVRGIKYTGKMIQVNKGLVSYHFPHGNTLVLQCCISEKPSYFR